jgi:hypothetical protein
MDTTGATAAAAGAGAAAFSGSGISAEEEQARMAAMVEKLQARDAYALLPPNFYRSLAPPL